MKSFFILSGDHEELARDELVAISKSYDKDSKSFTDSKLVIITSSVQWQEIARRATFVKIAGNLAGTVEEISELEFPKTDTFACRVINLSSKKINASAIEKEVGSLVKEKACCQVSLSDPTLTIYIIITGSKRYVGYADVLDNKRLTKAIKYPTELDWKIARCMVNLSSLREGEVVCDPFCGTGTILLEAESMGMHSTGIDFDSKMCDFARRNLAINGYDPRVINSTYDYILKMRNRIGAIVTDLPYGTASRSSTTPAKLIRDFVSIVPSTVRLVMVYKKGIEINDLDNAKKYEIYRHKSLTRVIAVR